MKGSTKSPKISNLDLARLDLKQIYTRSPNKPSENSLLTSTTNRSDKHISTRLNIIRLDTDNNSNITTSASLPMTTKSVSGVHLLNNLTSSLQGNFQFLNDCLGSLKGTGLTQLNFDELGHLVYDPKTLGFARTFTEMGPLRTRKTTEINTETTMSQTARSFNKIGLASPSGPLTARGVESGPKTLPVPLNIKKISRMKSESQLKKSHKNSMPGIETNGKAQPSTRVFTETDGMDTIYIKKHSKEEKGVIIASKQRRSETELTSPGMLQEHKNDKRGLPVLKKRNISHGAELFENKEVLILKEEESSLQPRLNPTGHSKAKLSYNKSRTKSMSNVITKRNLLPKGENITHDTEERMTTLMFPSEGSELRINFNNIEREVESAALSNRLLTVEDTQSVIIKRKRGKSDLAMTPRSSGIGQRLNILKLNANESHGEGREVGEGLEKEDILRNMESGHVLSPNVEWHGITQTDNQPNGKVNKSLSSQGSGNEKDGKQKETREGDLIHKESKSVESPVKKGTKVLKKKILALKIGKSFINSLKKKESSLPNKSKGKELQPIVEISTPPKKPTITTEAPSPISRRIPSPTRQRSNDTPPSKHKSSFFSNKSKEEDKPAQKTHHHHKDRHGHRKSISETPLIHISAVSDNNKLQVSKAESKHSSRRTSRDRNVLSPGGPKAFTFDGNGQKGLERKKTLDNPKSWFNFENKTMEIKLKKLRSFRINNTEPTSGNNQTDAQAEFIIFFDQTLRNSYKTFFSNNNNAQPQQSPPKPLDVVELPFARNSSVNRQVSQMNITVENSDEVKPELEARRNITSDNETTMVSKGQVSSAMTQISQLGSPLLSNVTEDLSKNSVKMYAKRDIMFTISISPPEDISSHRDEVASSGNNSPTKILEGLDSTSPEDLGNAEIPRVIEYRFDMNRSKTIEEDPETADKWNGPTVDMFDHSFRKTIEELFKFDEIYKSAMDNFNTKSQRLRIRSNFLSFVEKVIVTPMEGWVHSELLNNLLTQHAKKVLSPRVSVASHCHNSKAFKYEAKNFNLYYESFQYEFYFLLNKDHERSERLKQLEEGYFQEDDNDDHHWRLKSQNLVFTSGEVFACEGKLDCYSEFNRTLSFKPILGGMKHEILLGMKKILFDYTFKDIKRGESVIPENASLKHIEMYRVLILNDENWRYLNRCVLKMFKGSLYGSFELKIQLGLEKIVKEEKDDVTITQEAIDAKLNKKRDMLFSGKQWRSGSVYNQMLFQAARKSKNVLENIINKQVDSVNIDAADEEPELEEKEKKSSKKEILLGDNLKVDTLRTPRQDRPRRYSKTSIKPIVHSISERNKQNLVIAIEKSSTTVEPNNKDLAQLVTQKITKMPTNASTGESKAKLQIPRTDSNRQASSSSPFGRQETKVESPERKPGDKEKPTINYSLTPQSDPSPPGRDDALSHQSTLNLQWTKEKTKPKVEGSERGSFFRRDPSYGALSQNKDKEETTTKEILKALQAGRNRGESSAGIQKLGAQLKKETSSRNLVKRFGGGENHNNNHNNNEDSSIAKIDKIGAPLTMLDKSKTLPKKPEQALDKFLFDAVYTNKYLEIRELLTLYPKTAHHVRDRELNTLLMATAQAGYLPIAELLLQHGCDINIQNKEGNTALHISLAYHNYKLADLLISYGAKQNITNARGKTAWENS